MATYTRATGAYTLILGRTQTWELHWQGPSGAAIDTSGWPLTATLLIRDRPAAAIPVDRDDPNGTYLLRPPITTDAAVQHMHEVVVELTDTLGEPHVFSAAVRACPAPP